MEEEQEARGCAMPIVWALIAAVTVCGSGAWVGLAASGSERAGVSAATAAAGPFGFGLAGGLTALIVHFASRNTGIRIGVPAGCGCLGAIGGVVGVGVFFAVIFPML